MNSIYFSEFYGISVTEEDDWFDPRMVLDTKLCIDPFLVFKAEHSYFKDAKQKFLRFFETAYSLASDPSNHSLLIEHMLPIGEVAELCLGFSEKGIRGSGRDKKFAKNVVQTLIDLRKNSHFTSDFFKAIEIFTPGIGEDKISDAMANIIKRELIEYTLAVCERYPQITTKCFPIANVEFDYENGLWDDQFFHLPVNPCESKPTAIILVPKRFLRTIQSVSSDEFSNYLVGKPNEELRALLNNILGKIFKDDDNKTLDKFRDKLKNKKTILDLITKSPELLTDFFNYVEDSKNDDYFTSYDFEQDPDGLYGLPKAIYEFTSKNPLNLKAINEDDVISCADNIIIQFQEFIERHDGYKLFWVEKSNDSSSKIRHRNESILQNAFRYFAQCYCRDNKIKIEKNTDLGEKPVEFIFSNGCKNKVLIRLKLFANIHLEKEANSNLKCTTSKSSSDKGS